LDRLRGSTDDPSNLERIVDDLAILVGIVEKLIRLNVGWPSIILRGSKS